MPSSPASRVLHSNRRGLRDEWRRQLRIQPTEETAASRLLRQTGWCGREARKIGGRLLDLLARAVVEADVGSSDKGVTGLVQEAEAFAD